MELGAAPIFETDFLGFGVIVCALGGDETRR